MIFVTGPLFAGKKEYIRRALGLSEEELEARAVWDVQELVCGAELPALMEALSKKEIVIATEIGGGLIPADPSEREKREAAGRLACLLAERADTVVRVSCGLGQVLKGELP
ncbi:MAG: bifunctional adenosylcobinamide kinase/adenosylcobinamide-phosphate guanylyltransferase [Oscillospiraceae bacterium]|nr:bifunctional adenosylcobinamide kinase/adenosylcobinamide-phosphate guanylyltransferase [Oscillospiraceae bacterium]